MKFSYGVIIFLLSLVALVAEVILYLFLGIGLAFSKDPNSTASITFFAAFFVWLIVMTIVAGISAPICGFIENIAKKPNIGMYGFLGVMGVAGVGIGALMLFTYSMSPSSKATLSGATSAAKGNTWRVSESVAQMDSSKSVTVLLEAENEIKGWLKSHRPTLIVSCREGKTETYTNVGMNSSVESGLYNRHTVRVRFDEQKAFQQRWSESTDNEALFAPDGGALAEQIAKAKVMLLEFTPFNASPATVRFNVAGFDQHLGKVKEACSRKK